MTHLSISVPQRDYYEYKIPIQKLNLKLVDRVLLTRNDEKSISQIASSAADLDWYIFDPKNVQTTISEDDIKAFYQDHQELFALTPSISIEYISLPVNPTEPDLAYSKTRIDSLYAALQEGANFGDLAARYSHSPTAQNQGNAGYVALSDLPGEVRERVSQMQVNEISEPLSANGTWQIYLLREKTKSLFRLSEIRLTVAG